MKIKNKLDVSFATMIMLMILLSVIYFLIINNLTEENKNLVAEWKELSSISRLEIVLNKFKVLSGEEVGLRGNRDKFLYLEKKLHEGVEDLNESLKSKEGVSTHEDHEEIEEKLLAGIKMNIDQIVKLLSNLNRTEVTIQQAMRRWKKFF